MEVKGYKVFNPDWTCRGKGIREYLYYHKVAGIVFWKDGEPQCKIKRSDFGFEWPTH